MGSGIGQEHANLAVLNPPCRNAVLTLHPDGLLCLFQEPRLVHHHYPVGIAQMLHHVVPEVIPNQARIPLVVVQQALHPVRRTVAS